MWGHRSSCNPCPKTQHPAPEGKALLRSPNPVLGRGQLPHPWPCTWGWSCWSPSVGATSSQVCPPKNSLSLLVFYRASLADCPRPWQAPASCARRIWGGLPLRGCGGSRASAPGADETLHLERHGRRGAAGGDRDIPPALPAAAAAPQTAAVPGRSKAETRKQELGLRIAPAQAGGSGAEPDPVGGATGGWHKSSRFGFAAVPSSGNTRQPLPCLSRGDVAPEHQEGQLAGGSCTPPTPPPKPSCSRSCFL